MTGSLASVHPELIPEWSEKNLPLTPDKITFGSNKRVWWKGACGHEWETSVKARSKGEKCPICSGARVIEGINVTGGFGASANSRGSAVFCTNLHTGKSTRYERMDVMGEIKPECMPEWAKEKAQELAHKKRNKDKER